MVYKYKRVYVLIDTNVLLQYKPLVDINWCEYFDANEVVIVIARVVISELESLKFSEDRRKKERARNAIKLMDSLPEVNEPVILQSGTYLLQLANRYSDYEDYDLDKNSADDQLILSAIHFKNDNPKLEIRLLSGDRGVRVKAKSCHLTAVTPLVEWELQTVEDPIAQELKKLKNQAAAKPKLELSLANGKLYDDFTLPYPPDNDSRFIQKQIGLLEQKFPYINYYNVVEAEKYEFEIRSYNASLKSFFGDYENFLRKWLSHKQEIARVCPIELMLNNIGGSPAHTIRIKCQIPSHVKMLSSPPKEPLPPPVPVHPRDKDTQSEMQAPAESFGLQESTDDKRDRKLQSGTVINTKEGTLEIIIENLQHHEKHSLPPIYLAFKDRNESTSLNLQFDFICADIPDWQHTKIQIKVAKSDLVTHRFGKYLFCNLKEVSTLAFRRSLGHA